MTNQSHLPLGRARPFVAAALAAAIWALLGTASGDATSMRPQHLPISAEAEIGGQTILLEVPRTAEERALGLMFRQPLANDRGMLFSNHPARPVRMWMKNVPVPLDMVFIHEGRVVGLLEQVPPCAETPCPIYGLGTRPVDHVLELRGGRIAELGLQPGDPIRIVQPIQ
ncbi:MAG: DUF192 domain-containing protein [Thiocapsa sp.]|nr:DUF192 domain-containing protein [Thiocapsa sp.]MCG6896212.1 DUF192 domain-containing protein [Thiocapsa sp.]MCG6983676.1 DUF192 domain-containing protein [Thiocapsa sp.]